MDSLSVHGLGLVHPKKVFNFYNELHSYLASCGVDGVKVDVQNIIETLGAGHGGRVSLTRSYHQALEASVARNFPDNGCIACMCHNTDGLYSSKQTAVIVHPAAEYHGAARAVGGCAIYVSDKPGNHNFDLLRKLVLPNGSVLRAKLPGRPTRDCLFADPARDRTSLLKIWNVYNCSGVIGVFNCQGAGWCKIEKKTRIHDNSPATLSGSVCATNVDAIAEKITSDVSFAPIGLLDMFNSSAAMEQVDSHLASDKNQSPTATIGLKIRRCGRFGTYSSQRPLKCTVDNAETDFEYDSASGLMTITIPVLEKEMYRWSVEIQVSIDCKQLAVGWDKHSSLHLRFRNQFIILRITSDM
ncbi:unnamed protein product [Malus baccata var. baccata]